MTTNTYTVGTQVQVSFAVTDLNRVPVDPTTVTCVIKLPDSSDEDITSSIVRDSVGMYHAPYLPPNMTGLYQYEWAASGNVTVASIGSFLVNQSPL